MFYNIAVEYHSKMAMFDLPVQKCRISFRTFFQKISFHLFYVPTYTLLENKYILMKGETTPKTDTILYLHVYQRIVNEKVTATYQKLFHIS